MYLLNNIKGGFDKKLVEKFRGSLTGKVFLSDFSDKVIPHKLRSPSRVSRTALAREFCIDDRKIIECGILEQSRR